MTAQRNPMKRAMDITFEAQAIAETISEALDRLAESSNHDPDEFHRMSRVADACTRLLNDVAEMLEDAATEIDALRQSGAAASSEGNPTHETVG